VCSSDLFYSAPIINNFGDVSGGLVLRVAVQEMWGVFGAQNNVLLVDENGVRIADRSDKPQTFVALVPLSSDTLARVLRENRYGTEVTQIRATNLVELASAFKRGDAAQLAYRDPPGQTIRAATWRLAMNPWTVIAFEREDAILVPVRDAMADQIKVVVIAAAIAAGLVYVAGLVIRRDEVSQ